MEMEDNTLFNGLVLPTAWDIDNKSQFVNIDSSGLKVNYTDPNDYEAVVIRANNPILSQCGLFYFEIEIINEGKNGMIGVGYCTKQNNISDFMPGRKYVYVEDKENKENKSWGCAYHGDDGNFFSTGSVKPYGPRYTVGDTIGCYLNFRNDDKMIFYTKNGINLGIVCYLPNNLDDLKNNLYPCIGLRSQGATVEANFGRKKFKYLTMTNDDIGKELWEACWTNSKTFDQYVDELKNKSNDTLALMSRGKAYLIIGKYEKAYAVLTRLLEIESENIVALKYRGEINYIIERYHESIPDLENLLKIKPDDAWAKEAYKLVKRFIRLDNGLVLDRIYDDDRYGLDDSDDRINQFIKEFGKWTSGNSDIDSFIQQIQLKVQYAKDVIEWIPFDKFTNIKYLAKGGFATVFKSIWTEGYIQSWDSRNSKWNRNPQRSVCLKSLNDSKEDIKSEFLNEVENQHKHGGNSAIAIYGITRNPDNGNYMMVMQYAKQGSLRKLLDNKYNDLSWQHKINNLFYIAKGLVAIHKANLIHKDFHSGNIVNENMYSSYITDFGLCRPVSQCSSSKGIFGVLPYIAPEVLYGEKYTTKSDIYSFGIIMSEVFIGYPPYHDIPHDFSLATQICLGRRPEIRCEVPQSLLSLMNKCLDAEPQSRPTAEALVYILAQLCYDLEDKKTELYKKVEEIEILGKNVSIHDQTNQKKSTKFNYQTHNQAIYTSRLLSFQKLPKPVNAAVSHSIELNEVPDI